MYKLVKDKIKGKISYNSDNVYRYRLPHRKSFNINNMNITNIVIYNKKMARAFVLKIVNHKFNKLIESLTDNISSDSDDDETYKKVLSEIEKFRLLIKERYRPFLRKNELEKMGNKLKFLQKEAMRRLLNLHEVNIIGKNVSRGR